MSQATDKTRKDNYLFAHHTEPAVKYGNVPESVSASKVERDNYSSNTMSSSIFDVKHGTSEQAHDLDKPLLSALLKSTVQQGGSASVHGTQLNWELRFAEPVVEAAYQHTQEAGILELDRYALLCLTLLFCVLTVVAAADTQPCYWMHSNAVTARRCKATHMASALLGACLSSSAAWLLHKHQRWYLQHRTLMVSIMRQVSVVLSAFSSRSFLPVLPGVAGALLHLLLFTPASFILVTTALVVHFTWHAVLELLSFGVFLVWVCSYCTVVQHFIYWQQIKLLDAVYTWLDDLFQGSATCPAHTCVMLLGFLCFSVCFLPTLTVTAIIQTRSRLQFLQAEAPDKALALLQTQSALVLVTCDTRVLVMFMLVALLVAISIIWLLWQLLYTM